MIMVPTKLVSLLPEKVHPLTTVLCTHAVGVLDHGGQHELVLDAFGLSCSVHDDFDCNLAATPGADVHAPACRSTQDKVNLLQARCRMADMVTAGTCLQD